MKPKSATIMVSGGNEKIKPNYRLTIPCEMAEEFIEKHGRKVTIRQYGKDKLLVEVKE